MKTKHYLLLTLLGHGNGLLFRLQQSPLQVQVHFPFLPNQGLLVLLDAEQLFHALFHASDLPQVFFNFQETLVETVVTLDSLQFQDQSIEIPVLVVSEYELLLVIFETFVETEVLVFLQEEGGEHDQLAVI